MTQEQQLQIIEDLTPVCDSGDAAGIGTIMNRHFHNLATACSVFCVSDEKFERNSLPQPREFSGKGFLHSLLSSRRIMNVKNYDGGKRFHYTYTISFDTQFPSYLRRRYQGRELAGIDDALTECLRFLAPHRSGVDIRPYLFENNERLDAPELAETLEAYLQFRNSTDADLKEGHIESNFTRSELDGMLEVNLQMLKEPGWQELATAARKNWSVAYIVLLRAASIHIEDGNRSSKYRLSRLLERLDEIGIFPKAEIHFAHAFFERGSQDIFFRHIQSNAKNLAAKLRNMAWDLAHPRTIFNHTAWIARTDPNHADFVVPYILTFDQALKTLLEGFRVNGLISFINDGVKVQTIYPLEVEETLSHGLRDSQHLLTPERRAARLERGREFMTSEDGRRECIHRAESDLEAVMPPSQATSQRTSFPIASV
jgi:hypothetical protein